MTVIFTTSDFWIETIIVIIPFVAVDTVTDSPASNLERAGRIVGVSAVTIGGIAFSPEVSVFDQSIGVLSYGKAITGVMAKGIARLGAPTDVSVFITCFMRK